MAQIGKAWVEVRADLSKFPAEFRAKLVAAIKEGMAGVDFKEIPEAAGKAGTEAADRASDNFEKRAKQRSRRTGEEAGRGILSGIVSVFRRGGDDRSGGGLFGSISGLFKGAVDGFGDGLKGITSKFGEVGQLAGQLGNLGGAVGGVAQLAAFAILIPIVLGLAGALLQLSAALLALPAAGVVGLAVLAPLLIAFQGFGEAMSAGLSGDVDKFNEALKRLAPSAQKVVREFVGLKPLFDSLKTSVQQAFFAPLVGQVNRFGQAVLPVLTRGLTQISGVLGTIGAGLLKAFSTPAALTTFQAVLTSALNIANRLEPALNRLFTGLLDSIRPALPFVERFVFFLLDGLGNIGGWLSKISGDGTLTGWFARAERIGRALWDVLRGIGEYIVTVLDSLGDEGTTFLEDITVKIEDLIAFLNSDQGAQFLEDLGVAVTAAGTALVFLIGLAPYFMRFLSGAISVLREVDDALAAIGGWFAMIGKAIWGFLKDAGSAIAAFFTETIPGWFDSLVTWFSELPGKIIQAVQDFGAKLAEWAASAVKAMIDAFLFNIGLFIGIMLALPGLIVAALVALPGLLAELFTSAWEWVKRVTMEAWDAIVAFVMSIPGRLLLAGQAIIEWGRSLWTTVVTFAETTVRTGFDRVVEFFRSLPGRVAALGPALLEAARGLGRKIGEGLSNIGDFASDVGRKIVNSLKSGINYVIGGINRGISEVDNLLPGTLPRLPFLARGAIVDSPMAAIVGEAGPEVVIPLTDPKRAQELATQSGLLDMLRGGGNQAPNVYLTAILDGFGVLRVIDQRIDTALSDQGQEFDYGART